MVIYIFFINSYKEEFYFYSNSVFKLNLLNLNVYKFQSWLKILKWFGIECNISYFMLYFRNLKSKTLYWPLSLALSQLLVYQTVLKNLAHSYHFIDIRRTWRTRVFIKLLKALLIIAYTRDITNIFFKFSHAATLPIFFSKKGYQKLYYMIKIQYIITLLEIWIYKMQ